MAHSRKLIAGAPLLALGLVLGLAWSPQGVAQTSDLVSRSSLRVCADPANVPASDDTGSGYENKIAELLAEKLDLPLDYTWFPLGMGFLNKTLRANRWQTFWTVSLPLMRPGLANAFLLGFIESMADFGNPLVLGGNFDVLSTEIFFAIVGAQYDQAQAAVLAIVLLLFTLTAFYAQRFWLGNKSYTTVAGKGDAGMHPPLPRARQ